MGVVRLEVKGMQADSKGGIPGIPRRRAGHAAVVGPDGTDRAKNNHGQCGKKHFGCHVGRPVDAGLVPVPRTKGREGRAEQQHRTSSPGSGWQVEICTAMLCFRSPLNFRSLPPKLQVPPAVILVPLPTCVLDAAICFILVDTGCPLHRERAETPVCVHGKDENGLGRCNLAGRGGGRAPGGAEKGTGTNSWFAQLLAHNSLD